MTINLEYYIEETEGDSFNLWMKKDNKYYNLATLFYNDAICGNEWNVSELENSISYLQEEIIDELENPLAEIKAENAEALLAMKDKSPKEILDYFKLNIRIKNGEKNEQSI